VRKGETSLREGLWNPGALSSCLDRRRPSFMPPQGWPIACESSQTSLKGMIAEKDRLAASSPHWTSPRKILPQLLAILIAERIVVSAVSGAD